MSVSAPSLNKQWLVASSATLVTVVLIVAAAWGPSRSSSQALDHAEPGHGTVAAPRVEQAAWKIDTFPAGLTKKVDKHDRARFNTQRAAVTAIVREVYDALFLHPGKITETIAKDFAIRARRAVAATKAALPRGARNVQILKRTAHIGLQGNLARQAVATASISLKGETPKKSYGSARVGIGAPSAASVPFRMVHRSTLWLERGDSGWKVIAFDLRRVPRR